LPTLVTSSKGLLDPPAKKRSCVPFYIVTGARGQNTCAMKFNKSIGMILLAVYLIFDGLLGFGLNVGPAIFLLYIVALAAGVFILIGK
jgi:hypothetical protein